MITSQRVIILANGTLADPAALRAALRPGDRLMVADGGLRHLLGLGLEPDVYVGDGDSVSDGELEQLAADGVEMHRFPRQKENTDLELALQLAQEAGAGEVIVWGGFGDRWDQTLANILLLAHPSFAQSSLQIRLVDRQHELFLIHGNTMIEGRPGDTVSLIPVGGDAQGVTTEGLAYPLSEGTLPFGSTLGVSNELLGELATVVVEAGLVVCVVIRRRWQIDVEEGGTL